MQKIGRKGFTLAEVLMTLGLVGVIAVVTMTTVIPTIQDAQNKTEFVSVYSDLTQVTTKILMDNGGSLKEIFTSANIFRDKFAQHLNTIKSCDNGQNEGNCWHNIGSFYWSNGVPYEVGYWGVPSGIILNNGTLLSFRLNSSSCSTNTPGWNPLPSVCGYLITDVNGFKGPNTFGRDIYFIWVQEKGLMPFGANDGFVNRCTSSDGSGCAAKVLKGEDY
ncbi:MAG: type II secretion system protein [bacterium]